jgi:hypothetical protein
VSEAKGLEKESKDPENVSCTMLIQGVLSKMRSAQRATGPFTWVDQFRSLEHFQPECRPSRGRAGLQSCGKAAEEIGFSP